MPTRSGPAGVSPPSPRSSRRRASGPGSRSSGRQATSSAWWATRCGPSGWPKVSGCRPCPGAAARCPTCGSAQAAARLLGYPVMIKAAAGGGGRGIRRVDSEADMAAAFASAQAEAQQAFGDPAVFIERQLTAARHVEVQVIADSFGTVWAVGIRDCSIQRRNQKVIEESGCTLLDRAAERELRDAAIRLCRIAGYRNAGTVEFLLDPETRQFMFMEVNARLQVEHPVTEMTTGLDLVKLQLHVARGGRLRGKPPTTRGYAIEARLNAEDPENGFVAAPGRVSALRLPAGPGIRADTGVAEGDQIAPEFDSMIAKIVAWGRDRDEAIGRLRRGPRPVGGGGRRRHDQQGLPARPHRPARGAGGDLPQPLARPADPVGRLSPRAASGRAAGGGHRSGRGRSGRGPGELPRCRGARAARTPRARPGTRCSCGCAATPTGCT